MKSFTISNRFAVACAGMIGSSSGGRPSPSAIELYNIPQDPSEKTDLADGNPEKVAELQKRIEQLARESAKSLFLVDAFAAVKSTAHGPPPLPNEDTYFTRGDSSRHPMAASSDQAPIAKAAMSALGQPRKFQCGQMSSGLPLKADLAQIRSALRFCASVSVLQLVVARRDLDPTSA